MYDSRYQLSVLGRPVITDTEGNIVDFPMGKPLALFCLLALEIKPASRDELCQIFWPDSSRKRGQGSLRQAVWFIRRVLGTDALPGEGDYLGPAGEHIATDLEQVEALLSAGRIMEASDLWRGDPFSELTLPDAPEWSRWTEEIRSRYEWRLEESLWAEGESLQKAGNGAEALRRYLRGTRIRPYASRCHVGLLECYLDLGLLSDAEEALAVARRIFEDDLDESLEVCEARTLNLRRQTLEQKAPRQGEPERLPFVGRARELSTLARLWNAAKKEEPQVALICGIPGIGKTRLVREFTDSIRADGGSVIDWRAAKVEEDLEWGVAGELVKQLQGIPGAAGISDASTQALAFLSPSSAKGPWTTPGPFLTAGFTDAIDDLISAVSFEAPVLVVVDDFQWVDRRTKAILTKVCRGKAPRSVMFLLTLEVESPTLDRGTLARDLGVDLAEITVLNLEPLTQDDFGNVLGDRLESSDVVEELSARLHAKTGGNPLALEEALLTMRESGRVVPVGDGRLRLLPAAASESVLVARPRESPFANRLRLRTPQAQATAAAVARLGIPASLPELSRESGLRGPELENAVQELLSSGLLLWGSDDRLDLVHSRVRDEAMALVPDRPKSRRRGPTRLWRRRAAMGVGASMLAVGFLSLLPGFLPSASLERFGGGALVLSTDDSLFVVRTGEGRSRWQQERLGLSGASRPFGDRPLVLQMGTARSLFLVEWDESEGPGLSEIRADGSRSRVGALTDQARLLGASPDGSLLLAEESVEDEGGASAYAITAIERASGERFRFHGSQYPVRSLDWCPRRGLVAVLIGSSGGAPGTTPDPGDKLILLSPDGHPVDSISLGHARSAAWCGAGGDEILFSRDEGGEARSLWRLPVSGSPPQLSFGIPEEVSLRLPLASHSVACSPNGEGFIYLGQKESGPKLLIQRTGSWAWRSVPLDGTLPEPASVRLAWLPSGVPQGP